MTWDFETDAEYRKQLEWADRFVLEEVEPIDLFFHPDRYAAFDTANPVVGKLIRPLQAQVKEQGLWASHLSPELGGRGFGQVKLALLNEILGRSNCAPRVFGC